MLTHFCRDLRTHHLLLFQHMHINFIYMRTDQEACNLAVLFIFTSVYSCWLLQNCLSQYSMVSYIKCTLIESVHIQLYKLGQKIEKRHNFSFNMSP